MRYFSIIFLLLLSLNAFSQSREGRTASASTQQDRILQLKIAKLTSDMKLTKAQAEKFWPIYHAFNNQRKDIRREIRALSSTFSEDDDAYTKQERIHVLKQKELDLARKYKSDFLKVISEQQYGIMLVSEERFNQVLLNRLKERHNE